MKVKKMKAPKKSKQEIILDWLEQTYDSSLRFDDVAMKPLLLQLRNIDDTKGYWRHIEETDFNDMAANCEMETRIDNPEKKIRKLLYSRSFIHHVHPVRDWLNSLTYNEGDWIDVLAQQIKLVDIDYSTYKRQPIPNDEWDTLLPTDDYDTLMRKCFKKWIVAVVAGWMDDNIANHTAFLLHGKQGIFKTTWLEGLIPEAIKPYTCKMSIGAHGIDKDQRIRTATCAMIFLDEIETLGERNFGQLKQLLTSTNEYLRKVFHREDMRFIRLASFCGSTNTMQFLNDNTGSRRWLIFEAKSIDNPFLRDKKSYEEVVLPAVWGQAKHLFENGFLYYFSQEESEILRKHVDKYRVKDYEEELLDQYFEIPAEGLGKWVTATDIHNRLQELAIIKNPMSLSQLGQLLTNRGFEKKPKGPNKNMHYKVAELTKEQVIEKQRLLAHE